jgi:hypothetical protein
MKTERLIPCNPASHADTLGLESSVVSELVGTYRTFGVEGPLYEVQREVDQDTFHILVIHSGEELDYAVKDAVADPEAK